MCPDEWGLIYDKAKAIVWVNAITLCKNEGKLDLINKLEKLAEQNPDNEKLAEVITFWDQE